MEYKNQIERQSHEQLTALLLGRYGSTMDYVDAANELKVTVDAIKQRASRTRDFPPPLAHTRKKLFAVPHFAAWLLWIPVVDTQPESPVTPRRGPGRPRKVRAGGAA